MEIQRADLSTCHTVTDCAVSIDVLRAFTTAGYLFNAGVEEIILVSGVDEMFHLRDRMPDYLLLGEVDGVQIPGTDLGNSPSEIANRSFHGKRIIQRTSAGTQGVVLATQARTVLAAALTNISATTRYIQNLSPQNVTLIQTGFFSEEGWGDEDVACADAIEDLLLGGSPDWDRIKDRVCSSRSGSHYDGTRTAFPPQDLDLALQVDCFDFVMVVERKNDLHVMNYRRV